MTTTPEFINFCESIKNVVENNKTINQLDYDEALDELSFKESFRMDMLFARLLWKKFGEDKLNEALDNNDCELCTAYTFLMKEELKGK